MSDDADRPICSRCGRTMLRLITMEEVKALARTTSLEVELGRLNVEEIGPLSDWLLKHPDLIAEGSTCANVLRLLRLHVNKEQPSA